MSSKFIKNSTRRVFSCNQAENLILGVFAKITRISSKKKGKDRFFVSSILSELCSVVLGMSEPLLDLMLRPSIRRHSVDVFID